MLSRWVFKATLSVERFCLLIFLCFHKILFVSVKFTVFVFSFDIVANNFSLRHFLSFVLTLIMTVCQVSSKMFKAMNRLIFGNSISY